MPNSLAKLCLGQEVDSSEDEGLEEDNERTRSASTPTQRGVGGAAKASTQQRASGHGNTTNVSKKLMNLAQFARQATVRTDTLKFIVSTLSASSAKTTPAKENLSVCQSSFANHESASGSSISSKSNSSSNPNSSHDPVHPLSSRFLNVPLSGLFETDSSSAQRYEDLAAENLRAQPLGMVA